MNLLRHFLNRIFEGSKRYTRENGVAMVFVITLSTTILLFITATLALINAHTLQVRKQVEKMAMHRAMYSMFDVLKSYFADVDSGILPVNNTDYFDINYPANPLVTTYGATAASQTYSDARFRYQMHNRYFGNGMYRGDIRVFKPGTNEYVRMRYSVRNTANREMAPLIQTNMTGDPNVTFPNVRIHTLLGKMAHEEPPSNFHLPWLDVSNIASKDAPSSPKSAVIVTAEKESDLSADVVDISEKPEVAEDASTVVYEGDDRIIYPPPTGEKEIKNAADTGGPEVYASKFQYAEVSSDAGIAIPFARDLPTEPMAEQTDLLERGEMRQMTLDQLWAYVQDVQTYCPGFPNPFYPGQNAVFIPTFSFDLPLNTWTFIANGMYMIVPPGIQFGLTWVEGDGPNDFFDSIVGILTIIVGRGGQFSLRSFVSMAITGAIIADGGDVIMQPSGTYPPAPSGGVLTAPPYGFARWQGWVYANARPAPHDAPTLDFGENVQVVNMPNYGAVLPMDTRYFATALTYDLEDYCPGWPTERYMRRGGSVASRISVNFSAYAYETNIR